MADTKKRFRLLWAAHPLRALVETWLVGLLILFPLSRVIGDLPTAVFDNGMLMLWGACGLWTVLRTRMPRSRLLLQALWELGVGIALSLLMGLGLHLSTDLLGWSDVWQQTAMGNLTVAFTILTTPAYLAARIGVRVWLAWDRARQRRMLLSLMHAHLILVVWVMVAFVVFFAVALMVFGESDFYQPESGGAMAIFADRLFRTLMPLAGVWSVTMVIAVIVMLPPSTILSYFIARRTTRRLERLAATARAMRKGDSVDPIFRLRKSWKKIWPVKTA